MASNHQSSQFSIVQFDPLIVAFSELLLSASEHLLEFATETGIMFRLDMMFEQNIHRSQHQYSIRK